MHVRAVEGRPLPGGPQDRAAAAYKRACGPARAAGSIGASVGSIEGNGGCFQQRTESSTIIAYAIPPTPFNIGTNTRRIDSLGLRQPAKPATMHHHPVLAANDGEPAPLADGGQAVARPLQVINGMGWACACYVCVCRIDRSVG